MEAELLVALEEEERGKRRVWRRWWQTVLRAVVKAGLEEAVEGWRVLRRTERWREGLRMLQVVARRRGMRWVDVGRAEEQRRWRGQGIWQ